MKFFYTVMVSCLFPLVSFAQTVTTTIIKPPALLQCGEVPARLNNVVLGAAPPDSDDKPVIVFVHGWFDNGYAWFMAKNKWYENTYNAGYKSAFFFQSYSDEFEKNGKIIAEMIRQTCRHFNTNRVIAVCHSKGGYDMEYALYNENMWDTVQGVITLSTPFRGAPMSDLIAVPIIRSLLESMPIVGPIFKGKGSYQMQTAYMAGVVRPMMDNHPENRPEKFHCFASWGLDHKTVLPDAMPDDILKVVFNDYRPICVDIPGFGTLAGDLMSGFMNITGNLSRIVQVQDKYNNPQKNIYDIDGLAPYFSSIRPGAVAFSQPPPSQHSYLNHIDVLLSSYMWDKVFPEIQYFKDHPVLRKKNWVETPAATADYQPVSDIQLIQSKSIELNMDTPGKLYLVGEYKDAALAVYNDKNELVKTIDLTIATKAMFDIFHEIDLSFLTPGKKYALKSSVELTGFLKDGKQAAIQLSVPSDKTFYADEPLGLIVHVQDWTDNVFLTKVRGFLSRNINEQGEVIWDKLIPVTFVWDEIEKAFVCQDKLSLDNGIYNLSVWAEGTSLKRFATTSILLKQTKKNLGQDNNALTIYPNPSNGNFYVQFDAQPETNYQIVIYNPLGQQVFIKNLPGDVTIKQTVQVDALSNNLSKGTYLVTLYGNGDRKAAQAVLIK
ncbi:MAG: T9SS type A sorting domain-containing protein [Sphingobacteriales bacterium]|nr:T9SS type A sorting domain-containing protein [Sphingobacteriales bacterium]